MTDTKQTLDDLINYVTGDAWAGDPMQPLLYDSLEELKRIKSAEMPEPENGFYTVTGVWWTTSMGEDKKHFVRKDDYNALQAVIQRKDAELSDAVHLNDEQAQRVYKAEQERDALRKDDTAMMLVRSLLKGLTHPTPPTVKQWAEIRAIAKTHLDSIDNAIAGREG
jgi:hypothetical protein